MVKFLEANEQLEIETTEFYDYIFIYFGVFETCFFCMALAILVLTL